MRATQSGRTLAVALAIGVCSCGWFEDRRPDSARVVMQGEPGSRVQLITSTTFVSGVDEAGVTRVVVIESDTTIATLPFDRTWDIAGDYRFFAQASRLDADLADLRMRVFVDAEVEFDDGGPLQAGIEYRFVYTFNQFYTSTIQVQF
jgi:hypothetical protein